MFDEVNGGLLWLLCGCWFGQLQVLDWCILCVIDEQVWVVFVQWEVVGGLLVEELVIGVCSFFEKLVFVFGFEVWYFYCWIDIMWWWILYLDLVWGLEVVIVISELVVGGCVDEVEIVVVVVFGFGVDLILLLVVLLLGVLFGLLVYVVFEIVDLVVFDLVVELEVQVCWYVLWWIVDVDYVQLVFELV